jgi:hypothetical protein
MDCPPILWFGPRTQKDTSFLQPIFVDILLETIRRKKLGCTILIILLSSSRVVVFLLVKFFSGIAYPWIIGTHLIVAAALFLSFVVPDPGMRVG